MHITIRADGNSEIGYGHLFRSSAIAEELLERGHRIEYATTTPGNVESVCPAAVEITEISSRSDVSPFADRLGETVDAVLIDSYTADEDYQRELRDEVPVALVSDDTRYPVCADIVINGNLYAPELEYEVLDDDPEWCLGPEYLLLRRSITEQATQEPPQREQPKRALITMGGGDLSEQTPRAIRAFDGFDIRVDVIIGPGFSEGQERDIHRAAEEVSAEIHPVRDPDDLPQRMFRADFAVSTASTTTYELLALGTPIVSQPVVDNQEPIAEALQERNAAIVLEREAEEAAFRRSIEEYMSNPELRRKRQKQGCELVDCRGTERIADVIRHIIE